MSEVPLKHVLADVLLDGRQDVVAVLAVVPDPTSVTAGLSVIIVLPTRSHAASNQTRGL